MAESQLLLGIGTQRHTTKGDHRNKTVESYDGHQPLSNSDSHQRQCHTLTQSDFIKALGWLACATVFPLRDHFNLSYNQFLNDTV